MAELCFELQKYEAYLVMSVYFWDDELRVHITDGDITMDTKDISPSEICHRLEEMLIEKGGEKNES